MRKIACGSLVIVLILISPHSANAQDSSLAQDLKQLPAGTNALLIANLAVIRDSDVAQKGNWFNSPDGQIQSGMGFLPIGTEMVVLASQMDLETFSPSWTAGMLTIEDAPNLENISQRMHGKLDQLGSMQVVETSSDLFVFQTASGLATFSPANRQMLAPWITSLSNKQGQTPSKFLADSISKRDPDAGLLVGCDMTNLISPASVLKRARDSDALKANGIDPGQFADLVASLLGVNISATFTTAINATATLEFGQDAGMLQPVAKQLILEALEHHGLSVPNLGGWDVKVSGNRIVLTGEMSPTGLRRMISLFDSPEPQVTARSSSADDQPVSVADSTKQYFDSVSSMVDELQKEIGVGGQSTYKYGRWFKSYADKIDNLSMDNVDPDVLDWGAFVSSTFRNVAMMITSTHESTDVANANLMAYGAGSPAYRYRRSGYGYRGYGYGYAYPWRYYGGYGGFYRDDGRAMAANDLQVLRDKQAIHKSARAGVIDSGAAAFQQINESTAELRRKLTEKYPGMF